MFQFKMLSSVSKHCLAQNFLRKMSISNNNKFRNVLPKANFFNNNLVEMHPKKNCLAMFQQNRHHGGAIGKPGAPQVNFKVIDRNGIEHEISGRVGCF